MGKRGRTLCRDARALVAISSCLVWRRRWSDEEGVRGRRIGEEGDGLFGYCVVWEVWIAEAGGGGSGSGCVYAVVEWCAQSLICIRVCARRTFRWRPK